MRSGITLDELSARLTANALTVASMLLPGGKQVGAMWKAGDLSGNAGKSVQVHLSGAKAGRWAEFAEGLSQDSAGDLIDLWRVTKGVTAARAIAEVKDYLGIVETRQKTSYCKPEGNGVHSPNPEGVAMRYMTETRGLSRKTIEAYKVQASSEKKAIVFPSYSPSGELINRSYRTLDKEKKVWQEKGCAPCLFGWQTIGEDAYRSKTICITEGQFDAMTLHQWGIPCLSIPNGSGQTWIDYSWEDLEPFTTIYLAFDSDASGSKNVEEVATKLGKHRCLIVRMPEKDANACLLVGSKKEDAAKWIKDAQPFRVKNLVEGDELGDRVVEEHRKKEEAFTLPMFRIEWPKKGLYFREREVTVWTGTTSAGKTTFLNFLIVAYIVSARNVFIASMEMMAETNVSQMLTGALEGADADEKTVRAFVASYGKHMTFADAVGEITPDHLMEMMWYSLRKKGTRVFFIDSLMKIAGLEEDHKAQAKFLNTLTGFVKETGAHVHLVAHTRKILPGQRPAKDDVKGSSVIINNAHNIVAIQRNFKKDELRKAGTITPIQEMDMHDTEVTVEKQRASGWLGSYLLKFNPRDYTYTRK
jgi:twinkle protein